MNLAYVLGTFPQASETFIAREIEGLRARGHRIDIFSLFAPVDGPQDGVAYGWRSAPARALRRFGGTRALATRWQRAWRARSIQAVVAHFGSLPSTVALEAVGELPLVISLHARDIYVEAERLDDKLRTAVAAVTCTRANQLFLRTQYPAAAERIHLLYHGLPAAWCETPLPLRARTPDEPLRLLAAGRLVAKKGFAILLDACARLRVPFVLRIAGEGPQRAALTAQCERLGCASRVTLLGWASPDQLRAAYAWADVFCCPSLPDADGDCDGLPNVVLEAMSTGLPVVGSAFSGIPEAVDNEISGLLTPPGAVDALAAALARCAEPQLRQTLGAAAATRVRTFFPAESWLERLEGIIRAGCGGM